MTRHRRYLLALVVGVASALVLAGCATPSASDAPPGASLGSVWPAPPEGDVMAQGTVLDTGGDPQLCLGAIAESYPPQCSGIPIEGWDWEGLDGYETASDVTWGAYAVQGTYDGDTFVLTEDPVMLALYDPMVAPDPTGGEPGAGTEPQLTELQDELPQRLGDAYLMSMPENGWLLVDVVWDDGTWQKAADDDFGEDIVLIRSALTPVAG